MFTSMLQGRAKAETSVAEMLKERGITTVENVLEGDMSGSGCLAAARCRLGAGGTARSAALNTAFDSFNDFLQSVWEQRTEARETKHIVCYMDRREGDATGNLNIWSSCGAAEYSLIFQTVLLEDRRRTIYLDFRPSPPPSGPYVLCIAMGT